MPLWLTINDRPESNDNSPRSNLEKGLEWAQILGDASKSGFKRVFAQINEPNFFKNSLTRYTMMVHKRLMGETVLDLEVTKGDQMETHIYAHCAKNMSGAFTIFALNTGYDESSATLRIPPLKSGNAFDEYILTVNSESGNVKLNGEDLTENTPVTPVLRMKKMVRPISLTIPARSIAFWTFPEAILNECFPSTVNRERRFSPMPRSSTEKLLHELILEEIEREDNEDLNTIKRRSRRSIPWNKIIRKVQGNPNAIKQEKAKNGRHRRSIDDSVRFPRADKFVNKLYNGVDTLKRMQIHSPMAGRINTLAPRRLKRQAVGINALTRLFDKMELRKPVRRFKPKLNLHGLISPISAIHDIYGANSAEKTIFHSIDNANLPTGDIHMEVGDDHIHDPNLTPVVQHPVPNSVLPVSHYAPSPDAYAPSPDTYVQSADVPVYESTLPEIASYRDVTSLPAGQFEMYEFDNREPEVPEVLVAQPDTDMSVQKNIETVVPETQPTWETDRENYQRARENIQQYYVPSLDHKIDTILPSFDGKKISAFLPNLARPSFFEKMQQPLETRRRRRSVDLKMNDEIEDNIRRLQIVSQMPELRFFERIFKMVKERQEEELKDARTRCKIVSKSLEQRCLENIPYVSEQKRVIPESKAKKSGEPIKKWLVKPQPKPEASKRQKRSILSSGSDEIFDNELKREMFDDLQALHALKVPYLTKEERKPMHERIYDSVSEGLPGIVRTVERTLGSIVNTVKSQVVSIFEFWS